MGRTVSLNLDLTNLPSEQAQTLKRLVDESDFFNLTEQPPNTIMRDGFNYSLTVTKEKTERTLHLSERNIPNGLRPLVEDLIERMRK